MREKGRRRERRRKKTKKGRRIQNSGFRIPDSGIRNPTLHYNEVFLISVDSRHSPRLLSILFASEAQTPGSIALFFRLNLAAELIFGDLRYQRT
ncbi:hypothetical protein H6P81_006651 [Aristolochia fimbriata]|uniref:Uncharacterized protein n=1 Tax=Aristolochia fimbriata TaxID=158543 RepID=A0AAV7F1D0_ARIFI|nr:hypothetical protein H6P81_006651 [Aristolochia fimbriata]